MPKLMFALVAILFAMIGGYLVFLYLPIYLTSWKVDRYIGDGRIKNLTFTYLLLPITGYEIEFEHLPLDKPFSKSYKLEKLPVLPQEPVVYFNVPQERGTLPFKEFGTISLRLTDSSGAALLEIKDISTEKFIWTSSGSGPYGLYITSPDPDNTKTSRFSPKEGEIYTLKVDFTPAESIPPSPKFTVPTEGWLYIRAGGSI